MGHCEYDDGRDRPMMKKMGLVSGTRKAEKRRLVAHGTSLASVESLSLPLVHEIVISADIRCRECQNRISDIMSRLIETESVVVNVLDKKVVLTCSRYVPTESLPTNSLNKVVTRIFKSLRS